MQSWWVEQGLLRSYYLDEHGVESNRGFHSEGEWVGHGLPPVDSVSEYHIDALEPSTLVVLHYAQLRALLADLPGLGAFAARGAKQPALGPGTAGGQSAGPHPCPALPALSRQHAHLQDRIPLHHVARYLGISNVSLSRIRARLGLLAKDNSASLTD